MKLVDRRPSVLERMATHAAQIFQEDLERSREKQLNELEELLKKTPNWFRPFFQPMRYKAAYGGRAGGKSHAFAELLVARMVADPDLSCVCIREIQKSLKYSVKRLIESKISNMGVGHLFTIQRYEIHRKGERGVVIFQGMQDHTADSIKSLEGFGVAWVEEAQTISARSLSLLLPTIRAAGSEVWFSWNPEQPDDPVDEMFRSGSAPEDSLVARVNYTENPFVTDVVLKEAERDRDRDTDYYLHVWEGEYNSRSELQIFGGKWKIDEFEVDPSADDGPYYGADWGFGVDPTAAVEVWIRGNQLLIRRESYGYRLELDDTANKWMQEIPGIHNYVIRADCSRPESISHIRRGRTGDSFCPPLPKLQAVKKWPGSVEDGIAFMRNFEILIHPDCPNAKDEFIHYSYKANRAGDPTTVILDRHNHLIDSIRYALAPLICNKSKGQVMASPMIRPMSINRRARVARR